jgi:hypothetical protein
MLFTCQLSFALVRVSQPFFSATLASPGTYTAFPHARPTAVYFRDHATSPACFIACANGSAQRPGSLWRRHTEPDPIRSRQLARCCSASRTLVWDADFVRLCLRAADEIGVESPPLRPFPHVPMRTSLALSYRKICLSYRRLRRASNRR